MKHLFKVKLCQGREFLAPNISEMLITSDKISYQEVEELCLVLEPTKQVNSIEYIGITRCTSEMCAMATAGKGKISDCFA